MLFDEKLVISPYHAIDLDTPYRMKSRIHLQLQLSSRWGWVMAGRDHPISRSVRLLPEHYQLRCEIEEEGTARNKEKDQAIDNSM